MHAGWRRSLMTIGAGGALGVALAACGGGYGSSSSSPTPSTAPASASPAPSATGMPTAGAAAQTAVKQDWVAFFNPKTPTARRVALLENGAEFASALKAQERSSFASSIAAKVSSVAVTSPTRATVHYTIVVGGKPTLTNQTGTAVYQDGIWKVSDSTFCGLLGMESGGSASLPPACHGA